MYCRPFDSHLGGLPQRVVAKLKEDLHPFERTGLTALTLLAATGLALRWLDRRWRIEDWLERPLETRDRPAPRLDIVVPAPVLGAIALAGLVALSGVGCYTYYPAPQEVFKEMYILRGEVMTAAMSGDAKHVEHFIPIWDDWTRRLQVGVFLREGGLSPYRRMKAKVFRDRLEFLKHAVEEGDKEETTEYVGLADKAYLRMRRAYLGTP